MNFSSDTNYQKKYLKYKAKYEQLKGGASDTVRDPDLSNRTTWVAFGGGGDIKDLFPLIKKQVIEDKAQNKKSIIDIFINTFAQENSACSEARNHAEELLKSGTKLENTRFQLSDDSRIEYVARKIHRVIQSPTPEKIKYNFQGIAHYFLEELIKELGTFEFSIYACSGHIQYSNLNENKVSTDITEPATVNEIKYGLLDMIKARPERIQKLTIGDAGTDGTVLASMLIIGKTPAGAASINEEYRGVTALLLACDELSNDQPNLKEKIFNFCTGGHADAAGAHYEPLNKYYAAYVLNSSDNPYVSEIYTWLGSTFQKAMESFLFVQVIAVLYKQNKDMYKHAVMQWCQRNGFTENPFENVESFRIFYKKISNNTETRRFFDQGNLNKSDLINDEIVTDTIFILERCQEFRATLNRILAADKQTVRTLQNPLDSAKISWSLLIPFHRWIIPEGILALYLNIKTDGSIGNKCYANFEDYLDNSIFKDLLLSDMSEGSRRIINDKKLFYSFRWNCWYSSEYNYDEKNRERMHKDNKNLIKIEDINSDSWRIWKCIPGNVCSWENKNLDLENKTISLKPSDLIALEYPQVHRIFNYLYTQTSTASSGGRGGGGV